MPSLPRHHIMLHCIENTENTEKKKRNILRIIRDFRQDKARQRQHCVAAQNDWLPD